jgi:hypothetical protein
VEYHKLNQEDERPLQWKLQKLEEKKLKKTSEDGKSPMFMDWQN